MLIKRFRWLAAVVAFATVCVLVTLPRHAAADDDPKLVIQTPQGDVVYKTSDLLKRKDLETLTFTDISAYPRQQVTFQAIKMATLLKGVKVAKGYNIEFLASDGFGTSFKPEVLQNTSKDKAIAYLAVEDPANKWPVRRNSDVSAGPYYLFWVHPELSGIGREEWPFLIDRVTVVESIEARYPKIQPAASLSKDDPIRRGYASYVKNCLPCHTVNGQGPGALGPDLNTPMNPVEYFKPGVLRQLIRDPQSVRLKPNSAMGPFPPALIPDAELDDLVAYIGHMAAQRGAALTPTPDEVKAIATASLKSWETGDRATFIATADPDLVFAFPGRRTDIKGALKVYDKWQAEYTDIKVYIHRIIVEGDRFAMEYQFGNTPKGGHRTVASTVAVGQVRNGRVLVFKEYLDGRVSRAQEAGLMPLDEGAEPFPWPPVDLKDITFPPMTPAASK